MRMMLLFAADNITLALDSETPLLIRSCIIRHGYALSLCVSLCLKKDKGDTLWLPQSYLNLLLCCLLTTPALTHHLVF